MIDVALIGFGLAGRVFHAPLIEACEGLRLRAVVTRQGDAVADAYPGAAVASLDDCLADPDVGLVVVATPNQTHAPLARAALIAGKAVVVDKPFAVTLEEAQDLRDLADRSGQLLSVFQNRRWDSDFLTVAQLVRGGRLGEVARFESRYDRWSRAPRAAWKASEAAGAGVWHDLGPHLVDQALQLFGRPLAVACDLAAQRDRAAAPDYVHAVLRYERLRVILHADTQSAANDLRFSVHGVTASFMKEGLDVQEAQSKAGLRPGAPGWGVDPRPGVLVDGATGARETVAGPPGDYRRYYDAVAAALRGEGDNPVTPEQGVAVMEVLEAGVRSSRERREITL